MRTNRVQEVRRAHNLTRVEFAARLGVTARAVSYWETGARPVSATLLRALDTGTIALNAPSGNLIRRARRIVNLKQREAATLLGVAGRYWQDWESERVPMPALKWALFLKLVRLPADMTLDYDPLKQTKGLYR